MVHVYNCHPFACQRIVPAAQEPALVCCGGRALFVVSAGGCKVEAYDMQQEECPLICRFSTMGIVHSIVYSQIGDYLVTIEEKNGATYLRAYTNWRYQAAEKKRVGVRLLGHLMRGPVFQGTPKEQMEIVEIPLSETPLCAACCSVTGELLVACAKSLVLFGLKRQSLSDQLDALDFERLLILYVSGWSPLQVALCDGYVALQTELEVLVVKLENLDKSCASNEEHTQLTCDDMAAAGDTDNDVKKEPQSPLESDDFFVFPKHMEMLGDKAKDCGVSLSLEWTGMETEARDNMGVTYILYRRFAPDFFQGCSVEETRLHSLQLHPMYTGNPDVSSDAEKSAPACMFCFFSLPNAGYMYSLKSTVELISTYQYPEKAHQALLCNQFLYVITRNALQCFSVRCSAVAARVEDPYIDTTMKACPPFTMEVSALRIQLFIGLKTLCHDGNHLVLLTAVDVETERTTRRSVPRKTSVSKQKEPSETGHGWNLYVISTVSTLQLYREMVEYSKRYEQTSPLSQNCVHLLSEAHLLLRASLLCPTSDRAKIQEAFLESCAQLGDCFSRLDKRDCHLALPYYKMSGLSVTEVIQRNMAIYRGPVPDYGKGFLFFLKHSLYEETMEELSEETANTVLEIFSKAEPGQLPYVVSSSFMKNADPACARAHLEQVELSGAPSVTVTLCKAAQALRLGDLHYYQQQMDRHAEMLQVYGFIEEPKLLVHRRGKAMVPTQLARHLRDTQDGLLVAAVVALHENSKVKLEEAELFFQELCKDSTEPQSIPQLLVDFWEALLVASSQEMIIQELLFHLTSVYLERIMCKERSGIKALKTAEDLINSCSHYGPLFPWLSILTPAQFNITHDHQEDLQKLQSLLCGPTLDVSSIVPLLEQLPDTDNTGLSVHVLCATKLGQHEKAIEKLLDRCPQAIISYANHELHSNKMALWWQKLFPELCERTRLSSGDNGVLINALKETVAVVAMELNPVEFLDLLPDDGTAHFFLPHLLKCSQRHLLA
ncbi:Hermansky-Pudlak syndrome 3 protein isoform X2 [Pangasianodon hypophthalmus]|uniref:Hermansky-Pudlak syndrome 3 protein isoform X2 n=1 Tax=Pangasianodon hypophthalmus TaxID=310915 RepID=UPI00230732EB|nr:Hermansky-Pudlak syndrome 3 protein isoform X2 [Pangasianodon hypophthalmus]